MPRLTISAFARHRGTSRKAVYKAIDRGVIQRGADGLIDAVAAAQALDFESSAGVHGPGQGAPAASASMSWREREVKARALKLELEVRQRAGDLVQVEAVRREWFKAARAVRDSLLAIPDRVAADLAADDDPHRVRVALDVELREALEDLSREGENDQT